MELDQARQVDVRENIAVQYDRGLAERIRGKFVCTAGPERRRLGDVPEVYAIVRAVTHNVLYLIGLIAQRQGNIGDPGSLEDLDLIDQKRAIDDRNNGFGSIDRERSEPGPFAA